MEKLIFLCEFLEVFFIYYSLFINGCFYVIVIELISCNRGFIVYRFGVFICFL